MVTTVLLPYVQFILVICKISLSAEHNLCYLKGTPSFKVHLASSQTSPGGSEGKAYACNAGDLGSIPGSGRSPGEGNGNPLQCSCLENPMDGGAWYAKVHRVAESDMIERLHFHFASSHV